MIGFCVRALPGFYEGAPKRNVIVLLVYLLVGLLALSLLQGAGIVRFGGSNGWLAGSATPSLGISPSVFLRKRL